MTTLPQKQIYLDFILDELKAGVVERKEILSKFVKKWQVTPRTFDRHLLKAREQYILFAEELSRKKDEALKEAETATVGRIILSRDERLEIASKIAKGEAWKITGTNTIVAPTAADRLKALDYLAKVDGDYTPQKTETIIKQTYRMPDGTVIEF